MSKTGREIQLLLHNIRSAHNVGSMFRTADAIGVSRVYLSGYTPLPIDKFKRPVKEIAKTALGAEQVIPWEFRADVEALLLECKNNSFIIVGLEQDKTAKDYKVVPPPNKTLFVVGSEVLGMEDWLRKACDILVEIPMRGEKESLNVAVAFGVATFRIFDQ